jgi:hypothetical protein
MAKALNSNTVSVNLQFTADTNSAKRQLQDLQNQLTNLINTSSVSGLENGLTKEI